MTKRLVCALGLVLTVQGSLLSAGDAPDSEVNLATGQIESVDAEIAGQNYELRHTVDPGQGAPGETVLLTAAPENDLRPRMAITPTGTAWVVWWRDAAVGVVLCRQRVAGVWQAERTLSVSGETSRKPEITVFDGQAWVAYEFSSSAGLAVGAVEIDDTPDPFGRVVLATSIAAPTADAQIVSASGHLWVTWVQDQTRVGWAELDAASRTWSAPRYEPYGVADGVAGARTRIRTQVLFD
jgi:hypothetical protein